VVSNDTGGGDRWDAMAGRVLPSFVRRVGHDLRTLDRPPVTSVGTLALGGALGATRDGCALQSPAAFRRSLERHRPTVNLCGKAGGEHRKGVCHVQWSVRPRKKGSSLPWYRRRICRLIQRRRRRSYYLRVAEDYWSERRASCAYLSERRSLRSPGPQTCQAPSHSPTLPSLEIE
jgi:hypothetical protein